MMTSEQAAEAVIDVLNDRGWAQGHHLMGHEPGQGPVCAGLAFGQVMHSFDYRVRYSTLKTWMAEYEPNLANLWTDLENYCKSKGFNVVPAWNDHESTTEEDVRLVIKRLGAKDAV